jgi:ribosome-associated protein
MKIGKFKLDIEELFFDYARSGGPGGQNVNKVNSKVVLKWNVETSLIWEVEPESKNRFRDKFKNRISKKDELVIHCQETRNQRDNRTICIDKLKAMLLEIEVPPVPRKVTKISKTKREKHREQRIIAHRLKQQRNKNKNVKRDEWE